MRHTNLSALPVVVLAILAVVIVIQIALDVFALRDLYKRPVSQVVFGNKWSWVLIILFANLLGPILYLTAGRKPAIIAERSSPSTSTSTENIADVLYGHRDDKPQ